MNTTLIIANLLLVGVTAYYAWLTRGISAASRQSAAAAERAAQAAERAADAAAKTVDVQREGLADARADSAARTRSVAPAHGSRPVRQGSLQLRFVTQAEHPAGTQLSNLVYIHCDATSPRGRRRESS